MRETDPFEFGRRVRELRTERKLSQAQLGKLSGDSQTNIGWIEQGKAKDPKKSALRLADALGSTAEFLLYGTGERHARLRILPPDEFRRYYEELPPAAQESLTQILREALEPQQAQRRSKAK